MKRGEVWWALIDERRPVVLLSGEEAADPRAMQIVASASTDVRAAGVEVEIGDREGLPHEGVVRVAFPQDGHIFCTWMITLSRDCLVERAGALSSTKLGQLENALRLAGVEEHVRGG